jgi:GNAT superfamily N-acetyltransferase
VAPPAVESTHRFQHDGLWVHATDRADDGVLDTFFAAYDAAFVLANEKEAIHGFRECLALNAGPRHAALEQQHGPFRELIFIARSAPDGDVVGGANLLVLLQPPSATHRVGYTVNLNYLFVTPTQRGRGASRRLLGVCQHLAASLAAHWRPGAQASGLTFLEINDPFRLTPEQYQLDSAHAGIDQVERLAYWARMGATVLDWPYVQPALSADQQDDTTLALGVLDAGTASLPAGLLLAHLQRFFAISVLKGDGVDSSASASAQLMQLHGTAAASASIALLPLTPALPRLPALLQRPLRRPERLSVALREALA